MFKVNLYNQLGKAIGKVDLDPQVFSVPPKEVLIQQVLTAYLNNTRRNYAHTKVRSERQGGGRKPWRQKGTGRARAGSVRSPLFRKGGVVFGPRNNRNYKIKINVKMKQLANCMVLSDRVKEEKLMIVDKIDLKEFKTKKAEEILSSFQIDNKVLIVLAKPTLTIKKSFHNLSQVRLIPASQLNIFDLLNNTFILLDELALKAVVQSYKK